MTQADWPFDQPRNCAVVTLKQIIFGGAPILHVSHNADDHGWQFVGLETPDVSHAAVVSLEEIVKHDPSVISLADLPPGWHARRPSKYDEWTRALLEPE